MESNKNITVKQELKGDSLFISCEPEHIEIPLNLLQCLSSKDHSKLQSLCRLCFNCIEEEDMNSLISTYDNVAFSDIIKLFTNIQITAENSLPFNVCITCQSDAIHCYKFRIKCEKSDCILQSLLKDEFVLKEESNESKSEEALPYVAEEIITGDINRLKIESNEVQEEHYFELQELDDKFFSEDETLCIVQKLGDAEKNKLEITVTDLKFSVNKEMSKAKCTEKQKSCTFCSKKFGKLKNLREHVLQKHSLEEHSHPCGQCKEIFSSEHDLHVHSVVHKPGPVWSCNICQKEFKEKQKLRRHIQRHMHAKRFPCDACGKAFCEMTALRRHARVHTGQALEKKFACQLCDKRYSESSALSQHMARHSGEQAFVCASCGKAFATPRLLRSHRRVHEDAKPHACLYCDKRFRHASTLNTHHRTHTGEKPYVCAVCGKTFIQNSNLTLHMRTHTGERPYSCAKCSLKFSSRSTLKAHQRRHTGEKPYSCDVCGKRFARQDLSAHKRMHAGARPHACSACPKAFVNAARLRNHTRIHTGEKPFECATCGKTFSGKSNLVQHIKKHQTKNKQHKENVVLVHHVTTPVFIGDIMTEAKEINQTTDTTDTNHPEMNFEETKTNLIELAEDVPLEVTGELVVQDCDVKEIIVVDNSQSDTNHQSANVCVNTGGNYTNDVNLVPVSEGSTVKLYQLDQNLVQNYKYIVLEDKSLSAK